MPIKNISAEQILDSRGNPTVKVTVETDLAKGEFSVPSGASTGTYEALELRDGDKSKFNGMGVEKAVQNVEKIIAPALLGLDVSDQEKIDQTMLDLDGTPNKTKLGGNATIGVSIACAKAAAQEKGLEVFEYLRTLAEIKPFQKIPYLYMNLINGGKHAHSKLPFQEYHVVPQTEDVEEALSMGTEIFKMLTGLIETEMSPAFANAGDEGGATIDTGLTLDVADVRKPLELLKISVEKCGFAGKIKLAMDVAASSFFENNAYIIGGEKLNADQLAEIYKSMIQDFGVFSIEDPFQEEAFDDFAKLIIENRELIVVGDDLTVTNKQRLAMAIDKKSINGIIIKPNQIGTLTETLETMKLARDNDIKCIVSHRSGETEDDFIADLAYAFGCFGLKAGAPQRGERVAKYNRLKHITNLNK